MKFNWPRCEWCDTIHNVRRCRQCGKFTCNDCVVYPSEDECKHKKYEKMKVVDWVSGDQNYKG